MAPEPAAEIPISGSRILSAVFGKPAVVDSLAAVFGEPGALR